MSAEHPLVRRLSLEDHERILDLWRAAGLHTIRDQGRDSRAAFARQLKGSSMTLLGLEEGDRLVGVVMITHDGRKGWINRLAVDPGCQRRGFASLLVREAEVVLREQGIDVYAALVESDNGASFALFQNLGYAEIDSGMHYLSKRSTPGA